MMEISIADRIPGGEASLSESKPTREVLARLAELIWEREGRPAGRDVEFWLRAEAELSGEVEPTRTS